MRISSSFRSHTLAALFFLVPTLLFSQTDSTYHDLGRTELPVRQSQSITIKGADLQRTFFTDLEQAVRAFIGYHGPLYFVVDGNNLNDVNAYSIYDIEEVILIEDASAHLNGANETGRLILVKTKKYSTSSTGLMATVKSGITSKKWKDNADEGKYTVGNYRQAFLGTRLKLGKLVTGISMEHQRDVYPFPKYNSIDYEIKNPPTLNRTKFNANAFLGLGKNYSVSAEMLFTPQTHQQEDVSTQDVMNASTETYIMKDKRSILQGVFEVRAKPIKGLENHFQFVYNSYNLNSDATLNDQYPSNLYNFSGTGKSDADQWLIRDRLSYTGNFGKLQVRPSFQLTYKKTYWKKSVLEVEKWDDVTVGSRGMSINIDEKRVTLNPSMGFSYDDIIHLQGDFVYTERVHPYEETENLWLPHASASVNISRLLKGENVFDLRFFGSYSRIFYLNDLQYESLAPNLYMRPGTAFVLPEIFYSGFRKEKYDIVRAGLNADFFDKRLQFQYSFDKRYYESGVFIIGYSYYPTHYKSHRFAVSGKIGNDRSFESFSTIAITRTLVRLTETNFTSTVNGFNDGRPLWQMGWTNRASYKNIFLALDLIYRMNEYTRVPPAPFEKSESFSISNLYTGFNMQARNIGEFSIYGYLRNLAENDGSLFPDQRRYFGVGIEWRAGKK